MIPNPDTIYIVRDTVLIASDTVLRNIHDINATTAMNTSPVPWTVSSVVIAVLSLLIAAFTWLSQRRTEKNTLQINPDGQERILLDIIRHLYSNMVATVTLRQLLEKCDYTKYPSEEHLLKLKVDPTFLHPELFSDKGNEYERLHNLIILFRNYNIEIDTALMHLKDATLDIEVKRRDMSTLLVKPGLLSRRIIEACNAIFKGNTDVDARNKIHEEYERRGHRTTDTSYYSNYDNGFIIALYNTGEADAKAFLNMLNENVAKELGKNEENASKVDLIDFH